MFGFIGDLLGLNQGDPTKQAANLNRDAINAYWDRGNKYIDQGNKQARGYLDQVAGLYKPIAGATGMYADALGLGGAAGTARAQDAFQAGPGYDFALNQGLQAVDRRASSMGSYQSGGTMTDVMDYATGLANQEYGSWLDRLGNTSNTALAGQTGALNNLANLATGTADKRLGLAGDYYSAKMGANNQYAQGQTANKQGLAGLGGNLMNIAGNAFGWGGF